MNELIKDTLVIGSRIVSLRVLSLITSPLALATNVKVLATGEFRHPFAQLDTEALNAQIRIAKVTNAKADLDTFSNEIWQLCVEDDWHGLASLLRLHDAERTATGWGARYYCHLLETFESFVVSGPDPENQPDDKQEARLSSLEKEQAANSNDVALSILVARAHCAMAWAYRGDGWAEDVSDNGWNGLTHHGLRARQALCDLNPIAANSPALASTIHAAARWEPDRRTMALAFAAWRSLDPSAAESLGEHGFFTLPRWSGTQFEIELMARRAVRATSDTLGFSAYAQTYLNLLEAEPSLTEVAHADTFRKGVIDLLGTYSDQVLVNQCLGVIAMMQDELADEVKEPDVVVWERMLSELAGTLVNDYLTAIVLDEWDDPDLPLLVIGSVYRTQIAEGATLAFRASGPPQVIYPDG